MPPPPPADPRTADATVLPRHISLPSAVLLVIGSVIGSGIFLTSGLMMNSLSTGGELMLMWLIGGVLALCGCLVYAELGAMLPTSGGLYIYLEEAYGPQIAFLFGWTSFTVMLCGQIAGIALGFAEYLSYFVPELSASHQVVQLNLGGMRGLSLSAAQLVAVVSIVGLGALNMLRLQGGRATAVHLTAIKVIALVLLAIAILGASRGLGDVDWSVRLDLAQLPAYGVALIPVLYTFEGWSYLAFAAGEVRDPGRNLPRAFLLGIGAIIVLYLLVNLAYLSALGTDGMRGVVRVGEAAATASTGVTGARLLSVCALLSTLGCNAAMIFVTARVFFAMSRRGALPWVGELHPRYGTPHRAVLVVTIWSAFLATTGTYEQLYTFVTFATLLFSVAGGAAIFVLRAKLPNLHRPYRTFAYPVVPVIFVLSMAALAVNTLVEAPREALFGLLLVALGWPVLLLVRRRVRLTAA